MGKLKFRKVTSDVENCSFSCGVDSIDEYVKSSYYPLIIQHAYAYSIECESVILGYYQILFRDIELDDFPENISGYSSGIKDNKITAVHIRYVAVDKRYQRKGIGTAVLESLIKNCRELSENWPIRIITIDAINSLVDWYLKIGFSKMLKNTAGQDGVTTAMYFDCMRHTKELSDYNCYSS